MKRRGVVLFLAGGWLACGSSVDLSSSSSTGGTGGTPTTTATGGSAGEGGSGGTPSICADPTPTALTLTVTTDPPLGTMGFVDVTAECRVTALATQSFTLSCGSLDQGDFSLTANVSGGPTDLPIPVAVDETVRLDLVDQPPGMHQQRTTFLGLQDAAGSTVRWAAVSFQGGIASTADRLIELTNRLGGVQFFVDGSICPPHICGDPQQRLAIRVRDANDQSLTVLDTERGQASFANFDLDLWVGTARSSACVNVLDSYHFVLASSLP